MVISSKLTKAIEHARSEVLAWFRTRGLRRLCTVVFSELCVYFFTIFDGNMPVEAQIIISAWDKNSCSDCGKTTVTVPSME